MAAILNSPILNLAILDSAILVFPLKLTHTCQDWFPPFAQKKPSLILSDSTWWCQPSWILPCWIKKLHSFILNQLDDGSHLEFCHVGLRHLVFFSQIHSKTLSLHSHSGSINYMWLKLIHSDSTWWWQPSWILPCWIQTPCFFLSDSLQNTLNPFCLWLKLI